MCRCVQQVQFRTRSSYREQGSQNEIIPGFMFSLFRVLAIWMLDLYSLSPKSQLRWKPLRAPKREKTKKERKKSFLAQKIYKKQIKIN